MKETGFDSGLLFCVLYKTGCCLILVWLILMLDNELLPLQDNSL